MRTIRIATRSSALALWQARHVGQLLQERHAQIAIELVGVESAGDRDRGTPLSRFDAPGVFTRAIQDAVLAGRADIAVHSLKDLPTDPASALLVLAAVPPRGPREDVLLTGSRAGLSELPPGARIGTSSPRRRAFLSAIRPDLVFVDLRGNVPTRVAKLDHGEVEGLVLARAGLERLGLASRVDEVFGPELMLPAPGQGAIAVECRSDDGDVLETVRTIECARARLETSVERAFLAALGGGCNLAAGVWTELSDSHLDVEGGASFEDLVLVRRRAHLAIETPPRAIGERLAMEILLATGRAPST